MLWFSKKAPKYELVTPDKEVSLKSNCYGNLKGFMQVRALRTFGTVNKGDLGGYLLDAYLDNNGSCWLPKNCILAYGIIKDCCTIKKSNIIGANIGDYCKVEGSSIEGNVSIGGNATVIRSLVVGEGKIAGSSYIENVAEIILSKGTIITGDTRIIGSGLSLKA